MGIQDFGTMDPNASLKQVIGELANLMDTLNFLLNGNLDVRNIRANSITARALKVDELSAISANLGKVIAGILVGAYISTADGTYPRIDFSSVGNLLVAYLDATHSMSIEPNIGGAPGIGFKGPSGLTGRIYGNSGLGMLALADNIELTSISGSIDMSGSNLLFNSVDVMAAINSKQNLFSGFTGSQSVITNVDFGTSTTTSKTLHFTNGVVTSIT